MVTSVKVPPLRRGMQFEMHEAEYALPRDNKPHRTTAVVVMVVRAVVPATLRGGSGTGRVCLWRHWMCPAESPVSRGGGGEGGCTRARTHTSESLCGLPRSPAGCMHRRHPRCRTSGGAVGGASASGRSSVPDGGDAPSVRSSLRHATQCYHIVSEVKYHI